MRSDPAMYKNPPAAKGRMSVMNASPFVPSSKPITAPRIAIAAEIKFNILFS